MTLTISTHLTRLKRHLKNTHITYSYIYVGKKDSEIDELLRRRAYKEIDVRNCSESFKNNLFNSYIDLIGHLGSELNSIYWWAGFTASKNRFISQLLSNLFIYYSVCKVIRESNKENILIINPPPEIRRALKEYCRRNEIKIKTAGHLFSDYYTAVKKKADHLSRIIYFVFSNWNKIYLAGRYFKNFNRTCNHKGYYVLRTWVYPSSINGDNIFTDSFFGRLPCFLSARKENLIIIAGLMDDYKKTAIRLSKCAGYKIVPQEYFLKYTDVVKSLLKSGFHRIKVRNKVDFLELDVSSIIQEEVDNDFRKYVRSELLQQYIISNILECFKIHTFTTTYENNPWERVCFLSLKKLSPSTRTIGYQHAVVTKASANMFVNEKEKAIIPIPDTIITVGDVTKEIMEKYGAYPLNKILSSCALRHEYLYQLKEKEFKKRGAILIALEGVYKCFELVNFVFAGLSEISDYKVTIRTHPALPFQKIRDNLNFDIRLHNHFSVSNQKDIKNDLDASDILIYWGSTVSLEALMMGLPVIHVDLNDIVSVDPLFNCKHLKWSVSNPKDLSRVIADIYTMSEEEYGKEYNQAKSYIEKYLRPVTEDRLEAFIV